MSPVLNLAVSGSGVVIQGRAHPADMALVDWVPHLLTRPLAGPRPDSKSPWRRNAPTSANAELKSRK